MGGDAPDPPQPSAEERALQQEQTNLLRQQSEIIKAQVEQQNLLAPYAYKQLGLKPTLDSTGKIVGFEEIPDETKTLRDQIEKGFLERTQKALEGNLPVDPALERELGTNEQTLRDTLYKNLGPGYETSSAGIEALSNFTKRASELRDAARRGDLTLAEQMGLAQSQYNQTIQMQKANAPMSIADILGGASDRYSKAAAGYSMPLNSMFQDRQMQYQGQLASSAANQQTMAGLGMGVGSLAMAGAMFF